MSNQKNRMLERATQKQVRRSTYEDLTAMAQDAAWGEAGIITPRDNRAIEHVETIPIAAITIDDRIQVRVGGIHKDTLNTYVEVLRSGGKLPPVDLFETPESLLMADGFHRYEAHIELDLSTIEAVVHRGTFEEAAQFAEDSNLTHGRPLSTKDKYEVFTRRVLRGHAWIDGDSNSAIGQALGVGHQTIGRWWNQVAQLHPDNPFVQGDRLVVGKDGRTYRTRPIRKARHREAQPPEVKTQRRVIHNLRNAVSGLHKLGLDDDAEELAAFVNDLAASFEN